MPNFPKSGELAGAVSELDLIKCLECPICTQVPYPPVYGCYNGHIVCNSCRPHMKHCGLCRQPFWEGRNLVIENIINSSKFYCNFKENGCTDVFLGSEIKKHIKTCIFGPSFQEAETIEGTEAPGTCKWIPCSNGELPENAVEGGKDENGEKLYVARAAQGGGIIPGKFSIATRKAYIPWNCLEHEKNEYEILVVSQPDTVTWSHGYFGYVPPLAVQGGPAETGEMLYIGRWAVSGNMIIGKIHPSHRCCYIPFQGQELARQHYEVLTRTVNIDFEGPDERIPQPLILQDDDEMDFNRLREYDDFD